MNATLLPSPPQGDFAYISSLATGWQDRLELLIRQRTAVLYDYFPLGQFPEAIQAQAEHMGYQHFILENDRWQHFFIPEPNNREPSALKVVFQSADFPFEKYRATKDALMAELGAASVGEPVGYGCGPAHWSIEVEFTDLQKALEVIHRTLRNLDCPASTEIRQQWVARGPLPQSPARPSQPPSISEQLFPTAPATSVASLSAPSSPPNTAAHPRSHRRPRRPRPHPPSTRPPDGSDHVATPAHTRAIVSDLWTPT